MISVIVPVYNVREFVERCIDSILAQTYTEWELLLIDDGSTDGSGVICDEYAKKDFRMKVIHTSNKGVSSARNTGLKSAHGEWVCFIDSDDHVSPSYLSDMINKAADADIMVSGWDQGSTIRSFPDVSLTVDRFLEVFIHNAFINVCGKLIRRDKIIQVGATFDEMVKWGEDSIFFVKVLLKSHKIVLISDVNYHYNMRENTAVGRLNSFSHELAGFNAVKALMPEMLKLCTYEARKYFSPYLFLTRTIQTVRQLSNSRTEKLKILKSIEFDKSHLYINTSTIKERIEAYLILNKKWLPLLLLHN